MVVAVKDALFLRNVFGFIVSGTMWISMIVLDDKEISISLANNPLTQSDCAISIFAIAFYVKEYPRGTFR